MCIVNDKLYMFGGYDGKECLNDLMVLNLKNMEWTKPNPSGTIPEPRNAHTMTRCGDQLFVFGGGVSAKGGLYAFNTVTNHWKTFECELVPIGLRGHSATLVGYNILIFGGFDGKNRNNKVYSFDVVEMAWTELLM